MRFKEHEREHIVSISSCRAALSAKLRGRQYQMSTGWTGTVHERQVTLLETQGNRGALRCSSLFSYSGATDILSQILVRTLSQRRIVFF